MTTSDCFFCPTNSPQSKDSLFTIIIDNEKQTTLKFKRLKAANMSNFWLENYLNDSLIIEIVGQLILFELTNQAIDFTLQFYLSLCLTFKRQKINR